MKKGTKKRIKEKQLLKPVCRLFPKHFHIAEFPFKGKLIDVLFVKKKKGKKDLVAVELKIKKWKKAMRQAVTLPQYSIQI